MSFKKWLIFMAVLTVVIGLSGCSKKEAEGDAAATSATQTAKETPEPGKMEMVLIPAGEATIGSTDKASVGYPEHKVQLPAFYIDKYEVTNFDFLNFSIEKRYAGEGAASDKNWRIFATPDRAMFPIQYITYKDAETFCAAYGKRLPTEEEWERAARGPNGTAYPWGNDFVEGKSNTAESGNLKPVEIGTMDDVTAEGAHDMLGNVREWTSSWYAPYPGNPKKSELAGEKRKVVRGLSPNHKGKMAHLWDRDAYPEQFVGDVGFRCAKDAGDAAGAPQAK